MSQKLSFKRQKVLNTPITIGSFETVLEHISTVAAMRQSTYVCCANAHMLIEAYKNPALQDTLERADIVTADGKPICVALKWLYNTNQPRIAGMDLMPDILKRADEKNLSVFF